MKRFKLNLLVVFTVILITGCGKISDIEIGNIESVQLKKDSSRSLIVQTKIPVNNPSSHKIKITDIELKTFVNGRYIGKILCNEEITIRPKSNEIHTVNFKIKIANIFATTLLLMNPHQKMNIGLKGTVKAKTFLVSKKIEIDEVRQISF